MFPTNVLGRLYTVHPSQRECFYLRLLLINVRGPTSTVNGQLCESNHDACTELQLLELIKLTTINPHQIRINNKAEQRSLGSVYNNI